MRAITGKQQKVWSLGDYGRIGNLVTWMGESLVRALDVPSLESVLDVAAGSGNSALAAARRFAGVLATDYVPHLLEETKRRAEAEGVMLRTEVADAQKLQFGDGQFDVVMSSIGAMFAPDQEAVARELVRVCRSGGRIGLASWTPDSMVGDMFRAVAKYVPPPPGVQPAVLWGTEARVKELVGPHCRELRMTRQTCPFRFPSAPACLDYFRTWYGPTVAAFSALAEADRPKLEDELISVFERHGTATDGTLAMDVAYLEVVAIRS